MLNVLKYIFILIVLGVFAATFRYKPKRKWQRWGIRTALVIVFLVLAIPMLLFPPYELPAVTGSHEIATAEFTWVDESRTETYTDTGEKRAFTVKIWYPAEEGSYPLAVFSHGAFGIIDSNTSTCMELASNGYVAVSIGHTYQAMFVKDVSGKVTFADMDFVKQVYADNGADDPEGERRVFEFSRDFMAVRTADENFVLDTILLKAANGEEGPFRRINPDKIGLFGHSMGGASSVELGRTRDDIDAVINLEGTMFGAYKEFENGAYIYEEEPYPVPLLDVNSRKIYDEAVALTTQIEEICTYVRSKGKMLTGMLQGQISRFRLDEVFYFEALDEKVFAYTTDRIYEMKARLYEVEKAYEQHRFLRCSKSVVLNLMLLEGISPALNGRFYAHMKNGEKLMITRQYVPKLKEIVMGGGEDEE